MLVFQVNNKSSLLVISDSTSWALWGTPQNTDLLYFHKFKLHFLILFFLSNDYFIWKSILPPHVNEWLIVYLSVKIYFCGYQWKPKQLIQPFGKCYWKQQEYLASWVSTFDFIALVKDTSAHNGFLLPAYHNFPLQ